ncbi:I78 family peptidase inhibitor [Pseudorhodoferax soli]|nr:I78 family peptidase inhibitor [Pseudorhodoferax soli]
MKQWGAAAAVLALAGCAGLGERPGAPGASALPATCDAAAAQFAVGQSFGPTLERDVRARSGASIVRWLSPGQAVTMEFNPARLNLTLDGRSRITKVACG